MSEIILIVDDTPANLGVLVETLGDAGYQLMVAEDGEEALAQTEQTVPDLILLDVMMPGIDGFETCRRFKTQPKTRDVPVLFMTALNETADKVKAFGAGGVDYITKPIEHEEALARVRTHLALRRLQRELQEQLALKERFMRIAGHDLRNPLCLILMAGELARRHVGEEAGTELTKYLDNIGESAAQMRRIIDTFLEIRAPTSGGTAAGASGRVDLNLLCAAVVRQHTHVADRKKNHARKRTRRRAAARALRCGAGLSGVHEFHEQRPQVHPAWRAGDDCDEFRRGPGAGRGARHGAGRAGAGARAALRRTRPADPTAHGRRGEQRARPGDCEALGRIPGRDGGSGVSQWGRQCLLV